MIAVFPGTFDPITYGHVELVKRALALCNTLIVAIAANPVKTPRFSLEERMTLVKSTLADYPHVQVVGFEGLLGDLAKQQHANVIIKGVRNVQDFEHESRLAQINHALYPALETLLLIANPSYAFISSSMVKEVARLKGDVSAWVSPSVLNKLSR